MALVRNARLIIQGRALCMAGNIFKQRAAMAEKKKKNIVIRLIEWVGRRTEKEKKKGRLCPS